jgi:hypothetical protein
MIHCLLTLAPHRDAHITFDMCAGILTYLDDMATNSLSICPYQKQWPGGPSTTDRSELMPLMECEAIGPTHHDDHTPNQTMW